MSEQALATLNAYRTLRFNGEDLRGEVARVLRDATIERTIEGSSTLTLDIYDDASRLLDSGIFNTRATMQVEEFSFELVQVRKSGPGLTVVLEDLPIAALRRHDKPKKVAPNTTTHVAFSRMLVREEAWLKFYAPVSGDRALVELARGKPGTKDEAEDRETTWDAVGRIAGERNWRRFVRGKNEIWYVPETWLQQQTPMFRITENSEDGVDNIDFDFDIGKKVASLSIDARAARWQVPVGALVEVYGMGPANGKWLVTSLSRSLFSLNVNITLTKARPVLPEPRPDESDTPSSSATPVAAPVPSGPVVGAAKNRAVSSSGFVWPASGRVSSGFGRDYVNLGDVSEAEWNRLLAAGWKGRAGDNVERLYRPGSTGSSRFHQGLDIAAKEGTEVVAAKKGTVTLATVAGAYGNAVYIDHGDGLVTRYGHLSRIQTRRGVRVDRGERIGAVGSTGRSTGPHLHFEVRVGGTPRDPKRYLP